jgi:hypothetical protein
MEWRIKQSVYFAVVLLQSKKHDHTPKKCFLSALLSVTLMSGIYETEPLSNISVSVHFNDLLNERFCSWKLMYFVNQNIFIILNVGNNRINEV